MILFLTDSAPDYGADYLYDGFCSAFGAEQVLDWPAKPTLHGVWSQFEPTFDCYLNWPVRGAHADFRTISDAIDADQLSLLVVPTLRGNIPDLLGNLSAIGLLSKMRDRTICYDAEDHSINTRQHFVDALGYEPVAYFKRELPIGATWATPLPFGYPEERIVPVVGETTRWGFICNSYLWDWARGGMREQIVNALDAQLRANAIHGCLVRDPSERMSVAMNHVHNRRALCAISPAGQGNCSNRDWEIVADGAAPIWQTRTVEYPNAPHAGTEALYFDTADEAVTHVRTLLGDPAYAIGMAQAAQACLRKHHTTAVRARTVYESVHGPT